MVGTPEEAHEGIEVVPAAVATRTDDQRAAHAEYERERQRAIREGTWKPSRRRALDPAGEATPVEVAWAAGFLEGEGTFGRDGFRTFRVRASQNEREPLDRLVAVFGGLVSHRHPPSKPRAIFEWAASGSRAVEVMEAIYPHMSTRRRRQIDVALGRE